VIGLGSPFGDDAAGPAVVERLVAEGLPPGVEAVIWRRPDALADALAGVDAAVLVDASRAGLPPGTVHEPERAALREARALSSHGLGAAGALALAEALGRAPRRLAVVAVEAAVFAGDDLSAAVRAALPEAARRVRTRVAAFAEDASAPASAHDSRSSPARRRDIERS
jgi:hydrogenase maturation protease